MSDAGEDVKRALKERAEAKSESAELRNLEYESSRAGGGGIRSTMRRSRDAGDIDAALAAPNKNFDQPWHKLEQGQRWTKIREQLVETQQARVRAPVFKEMCQRIHALIKRGLLRSAKDVTWNVDTHKVVELKFLATRFARSGSPGGGFRQSILVGKERTMRAKKPK